MHLFFLKDERVQLKKNRFIHSLYIQYLSIYFISILKMAFDVNAHCR